LRLAFSAVAVLALAVASSGCESSQAKSARLAKSAKGLLHQKGLTITHENADVKVAKTTVLHDANGTAAVVWLRNGTGRAQARVPVAIDVADAHGTSLFKNNSPGLATSLVAAPLVPAHHRALWVNDQVIASGKPAKVTAKLGASGAVPSGSLPRIEISGVKLEQDVDGTVARGRVVNRSKVVQRDLVIFGVVERNGKIVAAGRGIVARVPPAPTPKPIHFAVYFIGDPRHGSLHLEAPPTVLR
jgi:hypothetical protein